MRILQPTKQKNISPRTPMKNGPRISRRLTKRGLTSLATGGQMVKLMSICRLAVSIWGKEKSAARQESRLVCFFVTQVARDVCVLCIVSPPQSNPTTEKLCFCTTTYREGKSKTQSSSLFFIDCYFSFFFFFHLLLYWFFSILPFLFTDALEMNQYRLNVHPTDVTRIIHRWSLNRL